MKVSAGSARKYALALVISLSVILAKAAFAANGSVVYTYDALGRVASASYDTGVIVYYTYDANGNRTQQVINVNTLPLCFGTSIHSNPTSWGAGLWSISAPNC
jgi:YD repeat-containing protein